MAMARRYFAIFAAACGALAPACVGHGIIGDGTSVSYGPSQFGSVIGGVRLPERGVGYWTPPRWEKRGIRYGTDELVSMLVHMGRELDREKPGMVMSVADLSPERGGPSAWHRSHQTGRDVDLVFAIRDADGNPRLPDEMRRFNADGQSFVAGKTPKLTTPVYQFDDAANWLVIKALLENPIAEVQYVFISDDLKQRLLDHATATGERRELIERASYLLHQPSDSQPHDDHMHVRIYCSPTDRSLGCLDFGVMRWEKKDYKYEQRPARVAVPRRLARVLRAPIYTALALSALPFRGFAPR